jgi:hypothetical protein
MSSGKPHSDLHRLGLAFFTADRAILPKLSDRACNSLQ